MDCPWCGGQIPLPENRDDETRCLQCGRAVKFLDRVELWFNDFRERYVPVEP